MNRQSLGALVALNVVLLIALVLAALAPVRPAQAQFNQQGYIMLAGEAKSVPLGRKVIYITEISSARMVACVYDSQKEEFDWLAGRELTQDLKAVAGKGGKPVVPRP